MVNLVVAAGILIVIMLVFIFILFKNIIKRMDENAKKYFVNKMQGYDYILEEKQEKLERIKTEIEELEKSHKNILSTEDENILNEKDDKKHTAESNAKKNYVTSSMEKEVKYNLNVPNYREIQFFNNYKQVKKAFTINNEKIIKEFISENKNLKEEKEYRALKRLRKKFDEETIYGCLTLNIQDQKDILDEALTPTEKKLVNFKQMAESNRFNIEVLLKYIDDRMEKIDPTIYIYTNVLDKKYGEIDKNIVNRQYDNMSEGIIIKYRNKIYDYSI